jgi:hypothetical protein
MLKKVVVTRKHMELTKQMLTSRREELLRAHAEIEKKLMLLEGDLEVLNAALKTPESVQA